MNKMCDLIRKIYIFLKLECKHLLHLPIYRRDVLEYILYTKSYQYEDGQYVSGLCVVLAEAIWKVVHYRVINLAVLPIIFPLYMKLNASHFDNYHTFLGMDNCCNHWWKAFYWEDRLDFLKWLIKEYKNDKTNIRNLKHCYRRYGI